MDGKCPEVVDGPSDPPRPRRLWPRPVPHGGPNHAELARLGIDPNDVLDFSVNSNPLGPSPRALRAIVTVDPSKYPDREATDLRSALAEADEVAPDEILVGNGSVELIWLLAQVYLDAGDRALVVGPTFGEYEAAIRRQGAEVAVFGAAAADDFRPRPDDLLAAVRMARPRLVFVCNPNNPTGHALGPTELARILDACGESLLVVDEAYLDFADGVESALALRRDPRVVVIRSMTKNFGLAGLRLGYAVADRSVIRELAAAQPPWSVNALAQAAGIAAMSDREHLRAGLVLAARSKAYLADGLSGLGLKSLPSRTNFWLVPVDNGAELRRRLLRHGVLVRDCASFGLPEHVRLAARPLAECDRLLRALRVES